jgi:hypothetical protein
MKLSVHGSRTLEDERVKVLLMDEILAHKVTMIVTHAEPTGVCQVARKLAKEMALPLKLHFLNFKYLRGAFEHRSKAVLNDCDRANFIHDGKSKGTTNELKLARKMNKPSTLHVLEKSEHKTSVGFGIEEPWDWKGDEKTDKGPSVLSEMMDVSDEEFVDINDWTQKNDD